MKNPKDLTNEETTKLFEQAESFLNQINVTGLMTEEEKLKLFFGARFIDIRVRMDGREYFFEGESIRSILRDNKK